MSDSDQAVLRHFSAVSSSQLDTFMAALEGKGIMSPFVSIIAGDNAKLRLMGESQSVAAFAAMHKIMVNETVGRPFAQVECPRRTPERLALLLRSPVAVITRFLDVANPAVLSVFPPASASLAKALCEQDFERVVGIMMLDKYRAASPMEALAEIAKDRAEKIVHASQARIASATKDVAAASDTVQEQATIVKNMTATARERAEEAAQAVADGNAAVDRCVFRVCRSKGRGEGGRAGDTGVVASFQFGHLQRTQALRVCAAVELMETF